MQVKDVEHAVMAVLMLLAYQPLPKLGKGMLDCWLGYNSGKWEFAS